MRFAVWKSLVLIVVATTAGTGTAFVVPPTRAEYGQCSVDRSTQQQSNNLYVGGASRRRRPARPESALFGRSKISDEELEERKEQLRELLCVTKKEIDNFVRKYRGMLLRSDMVQAYRPKLTLFQERLGINQKAAAELCVVHRLLTNSLETLEGKMNWLQDRLHLTESQLLSIIKRGALGYSIEDHIEPSLKNLQSCLELSDEELTKMIVRVPDVFFNVYSADNLSLRLPFLQDILNIEENDIARLRKIIMRNPDIVFWPEDRMIEKQKWIKDRFGFDDAKIAQLCRNAPYLLVAKIETLQEKVDWLQKELHSTGEELNKMISATPGLFGLTVEKTVKPKIKYLRQTFQLNNDALREMLLRMPQLLTYCEKTIEKKLNFYVKLVGERAAKKLVVERPYLIANYSVENRLEPRLEEVRKSGEKVKWDETLISRLAVRSDDQWGKYGLRELKTKGSSIQVYSVLTTLIP